jgi:hypothetical protein
MYRDRAGQMDHVLGIKITRNKKNFTNTIAFSSPICMERRLSALADE